jgi:hypothetical protein
MVCSTNFALSKFSDVSQEFIGNSSLLASVGGAVQVEAGVGTLASYERGLLRSPPLHRTGPMHLVAPMDTLAL